MYRCRVPSDGREAIVKGWGCRMPMLGIVRRTWEPGDQVRQRSLERGLRGRGIERRIMLPG